MAWCAGARLGIALAIALVVTEPLARVLTTTPGGEGGLFAGGGLTLIDIAMGARPGSLAPSRTTLLLFGVLLAVFEVLASAALFQAARGRASRVLEDVGRVLPRFVLLAGIKLAVSAILFGILAVTLPRPSADWLSSRFGIVAIGLYAFSFALIALVLRVVFDVARGVSVAREPSLAALARATWFLVSRNGFALVWRVVVFEAARLCLLGAAAALGYLALTRRFAGAPAFDFALAFALQQGLVALTVLLDAVWTRAVTRIVASDRSAPPA